MNSLREAAQQALEALEFMADEWGFAHKANRPERWQAIEALRAALAQPLPDPVDEYRKGFIDGQIDMRDRPDEQAEKAPHTIIKLPPLPEPNWNERVYGGHGNEITHRWFTDHQMREYARQAVCESEDAWQSRATAPHRREWRSLSEGEVASCWAKGFEACKDQTVGDLRMHIARAIEAALRSKNQ